MRAVDKTTYGRAVEPVVRRVNVDGVNLATMRAELARAEIDLASETVIAA